MKRSRPSQRVYPADSPQTTDFMDSLFVIVLACPTPDFLLRHEWLPMPLALSCMLGLQNSSMAVAYTVVSAGIVAFAG